MSGRAWYKRCGADFIEGTMGLSLEEKGAYSLVLDLIYSHGGPIADDPRWLAGVCNVSTRKWATIQKTLISAGKITVKDGRIWSAIVDRWTTLSGRESLPHRLRAAVIERDGKVCAYCGLIPETVEIDHIIPVSRGGRTTLGNLTVACLPCTRSKGAKTVQEWLS